MNSEKVKEIKKVLKEGKFTIIEHYEKGGRIMINFAEILTLINELESDNGRMKQSNENILFVNEQVIKQNTELKDRIAELEKENDEKLKQFAKVYLAKMT